MKSWGAVTQWIHFQHNFLRFRENCGRGYRKIPRVREPGRIREPFIIVSLFKGNKLLLTISCLKEKVNFQVNMKGKMKKKWPSLINFLFYFGIHLFEWLAEILTMAKASADPRTCTNTPFCSHSPTSLLTKEWVAQAECPLYKMLEYRSVSHLGV